MNGLTDRQITKDQKNFWSVINDKNKISKNILLNHHVKVVEHEEKIILEIDIPAANRHDKPVYIGTDPMRGTYRRDFGGDFCVQKLRSEPCLQIREISLWIQKF